MDIMVSVCCLTYNHEDFIAAALEGFLMQKTKFAFEAIIHDDASTDGTREIIMEYAGRYPDIFRPIYQTENHFSRTGRYPLAEYVFPRARGKYLAECDGDDYWTDPLKLQKQVDFLEANPDYVMCHHAYNILQGGAFRQPSIDRPRDYSRDELVGFKNDGYGIGACTKMYRNFYREETRKDFEDFHGDYPMNVMLGMYGKCKFIEGILPSVYRKHGNNSWAGLPREEIGKRTKAIYGRLLDLMKARGNEHYINLRKRFV